MRKRLQHHQCQEPEPVSSQKSEYRDSGPPLGVLVMPHNPTYFQPVRPGSELQTRRRLIHVVAAAKYEIICYAATEDQWGWTQFGVTEFWGLCSPGSQDLRLGCDRYLGQVLVVCFNFWGSVGTSWLPHHGAPTHPIT